MSGRNATYIAPPTAMRKHLLLGFLSHSCLTLTLSGCGGSPSVTTPEQDGPNYPSKPMSDLATGVDGFEGVYELLSFIENRDSCDEGSGEEILSRYPNRVLYLAHVPPREGASPPEGGEVLGEVEERIEAGLCDENDAASCGPTLARVRRGEVDSWTLRAQFFARRGKSLVGLESSLSLEPVESGHCRVYRYENTATLVGETLRIETLSRRSDELEGLFACFNTDEHLRVTADEPCAKRTTLVARRLGDL